METDPVGIAAQIRYIFFNKRENPHLSLPHFREKFTEIKLHTAFKFVPILWAKSLAVFMLKSYFLISGLTKTMSWYKLVVSVVPRCWCPLSNLQFKSSGRRRIFLITINGTLLAIAWRWLSVLTPIMVISHVTEYVIYKSHYSKLGSKVVVNIYNLKAFQRQMYLTWTRLFYFSLKNISSSCIIMLLSPNEAAVIFAVKIIKKTSLSP